MLKKGILIWKWTMKYITFMLLIYEYLKIKKLKQFVCKLDKILHFCERKKASMYI